ncbi:MAG: hypothetical protein WB624_22125 [Xanthobacteraceae bacterium]
MAWTRISATSPMSASARPCSARRCSRTSMAREFSDETERLMDHAIRGLIGRAFDRATGILNTHRAVHEKTAQVLLQQETLEGGRYRETARADRFRG